MLPSCVKLDQSPSTSQHHRLRSTPTLLSQTAVEKAGIPYASPSSSISPENHNMERKPGMVGKDIEAHESESSARMDTRKKSQDAKLTDAIFEAPESSHIGAGHGQKLSSSQMQSWPIARSTTHVTASLNPWSKLQHCSTKLTCEGFHIMCLHYAERYSSSSGKCGLGSSPRSVPSCASLWFWLCSS